MYKMDLPESMRYFSKSFLFNNKNFEEEIFMCNEEKLVMVNFKTQKIRDVYTFENPLAAQPDYFLMNEEQNIGLVASSDDALWFDVKNKSEVDLDDTYYFGDIRAIMYHNSKFYIIANRYNKQI